MDELLAALIDKCGSCQSFEYCAKKEVDREDPAEVQEIKLKAFWTKSKCDHYKPRPAWADKWKR